MEAFGKLDVASPGHRFRTVQAERKKKLFGMADLNPREAYGRIRSSR
jgi:hypothetical protein